MKKNGVIQKSDTFTMNVFSQIERKHLRVQDFFLVRDYQNHILIADDDKNKTAIIMLNRSVGYNGYEREVPRLIHQYKSSGYHMECIVYLTQEGNTPPLHKTQSFAYKNYIYLIDTYRIPC